METSESSFPLQPASLVLSYTEVGLLHSALDLLEPSDPVSSLRQRLGEFMRHGEESQVENSVSGSTSAPAPALVAAPDADRNNPPGNGGPCPRNGRALRLGRQWRASGIFQRAANLTSDSIILDLASAHYNSPLEGPAAWVQSVKSFLFSKAMNFKGSDLSSVIARCRTLGSKDIAGRFFLMLSEMQIAFTCQR